MINGSHIFANIASIITSIIVSMIIFIRNCNFTKSAGMPMADSIFIPIRIKGMLKFTRFKKRNCNLI